MNHLYKIYTTVDITPTGVVNGNYKDDTNYDLKRNQQRNYDTLCQVISLRANIHNPTVAENLIERVPAVFPNPNLPDEYKIWELNFRCDRQLAFGEHHEALYNDLHMVPIVPALTETVPQFPPYFISFGDLRNIYIPESKY
jgi:hypothetical protein